MTVALVVIVAALLFCAFWSGSMWLIAQAGGWAELAKIYRGDEETFGGATWSFQSARFRFNTRYGNILTIGANEQALMLKMMGPFRIAHPTLIIPWSDMSVQAQRGLFIDYAVFSFHRAATIQMKIMQRRAVEIVAYSHDQRLIAPLMQRAS